MKLINHYCDLCKEEDDESIATHHCNNCEKNLCELHLQLHNKKKYNQNHNLICLCKQKDQSSSSTSNNPTYQHYCKKHPEYLLDIYCKECNEPICAAFYHQLHNYIDITIIIKEEQENLNKLLNNLNLKKEIFLQRNRDIELTIIKVNEQIELNKNEIKQHFDEIIKTIYGKMENLILEVETIGKDNLQRLQNEKQLLDEHFNDLNKVCQLNSNLNYTDILQNKLILENKIMQLNKLKIISDLNEMNNFEVNIENNKKNLIQFVENKLGNIDYKKSNNSKLLFNTDILQRFDLQLIDFELINKFGTLGEGNNNLKLPCDINYNNNLIYVTDNGNKRILILNSFLKYISEIKLNSSPLSLTSNKQYLYIGCSDNIIKKYNINTLQLMKTIKSTQYFNYIEGMTLDEDNNLFICNNGNQEIVVLNENDAFIRKFKINSSSNPRRIIINSKNQIVITTCEEIHIFDKLGKFILKVKFYDSSLYGMISDNYNNYIICDRKNNKLLVLDSNFNIKKEFNEDLNKPLGISLHKESNQIYVVENWGHCVKLFK